MCHCDSIAVSGSSRPSWPVPHLESQLERQPMAPGQEATLLTQTSCSPSEVGPEEAWPCSARLAVRTFLPRWASHGTPSGPQSTVSPCLLAAEASSAHPPASSPWFTPLGSLSSSTPREAPSAARWCSSSHPCFQASEREAPCLLRTSQSTTAHALLCIAVDGDPCLPPYSLGGSLDGLPVAGSPKGLWSLF